MTKDFIRLGLLLVLDFGCNPKSSTQEKTSSNVKEKIQGVWAISQDANSSFKVKGDSLYFFEDPNPVFFLIKEDSFIYYMGDEKYYNKILKLDSDSIIFIENGDVIKLYNRK